MSHTNTKALWAATVQQVNTVQYSTSYSTVQYSHFGHGVLWYWGRIQCAGHIILSSTGTHPVNLGVFSSEGPRVDNIVTCRRRLSCTGIWFGIYKASMLRSAGDSHPGLLPLYRSTPP